MVAAVERKLGEARAALQKRRVLSLSSPVPSPPTASTSPLLDEVERHANELVSRVASLWLNATGRAQEQVTLGSVHIYGARDILSLMPHESGRVAAAYAHVLMAALCTPGMYWMFITPRANSKT